jgi:hypothetical protein
VLSVTGESAVVRSSPLAWDGTSLSIGSPREELVRWSHNGQSLIDPPSPGDTVSLHWDWVCDTLTGEQASAIVSQEERYLGPSRS